MLLWLRLRLRPLGRREAMKDCLAALMIQKNLNLKL
jgi:hypothetical protein